MHHKLKEYSLILFAFSMYLVSCSIFVNDIYLHSDRLVYFYRYAEIDKVVNPFGIEFLLSILMNICDYFGLDFYEFLLVFLLLWLPVVGLIAKNCVKYPVLVVALLYFFTFKFVDNATFLMRSFIGLPFLMGAVLSTRRSYRWTFSLLAVFSHISNGLFLLLGTIKTYNILLINRNRSILFLMISLLAKYIIGSDFFQIINYYEISNYLLGDINRKLSFYHLAYSFSHINYFIFFLLFVLSILLCFHDARTNSMKRFNALVFSQVLLCISFSGISVFANRIGIVPFVFSIPLVIFYINEVIIKKAIR